MLQKTARQTRYSHDTPQDIAAAATGSSPGLVIIKHTPFNAEAPICALREAYTPTEQFYVRSNFDTPPLELGSWRLRIDGTVDSSVELSLEDLRSLPASDVTATLECAGNNRTTLAPLPRGEPWGPGAVSTAWWRGAALTSVFRHAGLHASALELRFEGADRGAVEGSSEPIPFARSLPLSKALHPDTLLAYEMNGAPLQAEHGGPVRLLVPGWYGMASVKWLARITALEQPFTGYFQAQRYVLELPGSAAREPLREMLVKSLITNPLPGDTLARGQQTISGFAWSGTGAIKSVEVSVEGAGAWQEATLVGEAAQYGWRRWEYRWEAERPGRYVLRARATDESGNVQPDVAAWNRLGYANNAIQPVIVQVSE